MTADSSCDGPDSEASPVLVADGSDDGPDSEASPAVDYTMLVRDAKNEELINFYYLFYYIWCIFEETIDEYRMSAAGNSAAGR